jgi:hypothetical protein
MPYTSLVKQESFTVNFVQQTNLYFNDPDTNRSARAIVRAFAKNPALEVEVNLDPIPASQGGQEVTANFFAYNLDHNETFYTDSSAMEMQKRILNFRPTWNLTTNEPVSSNYYPINQAIVIQDEEQNLAFVVTNDRAQGGSVIENGRIEFMHNRRLFEDDSRGVGEPLSENGTYGNGISVQATYTVHFVNKTQTYSKQRYQQLSIDDPLQLNFAFNYTITPMSTEEAPMTLALPEGIVRQRNGIPAPIKVTSYPMDRNVLMVRIENIGDLFDYPKGATLQDTVAYVDLTALAKDFWYKANGQGTQLSRINIQETQLTGITSQTDMKKNRYQWKGVDDGQVVEPVLPKDLPNNVIALSAQRIRVFYFEYVPLN